MTLIILLLKVAGLALVALGSWLVIAAFVEMDRKHGREEMIAGLGLMVAVLRRAR